jgi:hypothetical protein
VPGGDHGECGLQQALRQAYVDAVNQRRRAPAVADPHLYARRYTLIHIREMESRLGKRQRSYRSQVCGRMNSPQIVILAKWAGPSTSASSPSSGTSSRVSPCAEGPVDSGPRRHAAIDQRNASERLANQNCCSCRCRRSNLIWSVASAVPKFDALSLFVATSNT